MYFIRPSVQLQRCDRAWSSVVLGALCCVMTACDVKEVDQHLPQTPSRWEASPAAKAAVVDGRALKEWWKQFNDPTLNFLIAQALENNPDVHVAAAKIDEARGLEHSARAALLPKLDGAADLSQSRQALFQPITGKTYDANFDASYELDVFGKNRTAAEGAGAATRAAQQDLDWVKLSMAAEVARNYLSMCAAEKQITLAEKNLSLEKDTHKLTDQRQKAGGTSEFDVARSDVQVHQSAARIAGYKRERDDSALALVTLTGLTPQALKAHIHPTKNIPGIGLAAMVTAPASVLSSRPDIVAANARFAQATSLKESQAAAIFPDISLSGMFGVTRNVYVTDRTQVWNIGGNAVVNLIDFGRIQGQIDAASAREVEAYENWRKSILQAMQDVETSLSNAARLQEQRGALTRAKQSAEKSLDLAKVRYRAGDSSLLDVLDAQRELIDADSALIDAETNYVTSIVALYKALGQY